MLGRVNFMALYLTNFPAFLDSTLQISRSFQFWSWQPYLLNSCQWLGAGNPISKVEPQRTTTIKILYSLAEDNDTPRWRNSTVLVPHLRSPFLTLPLTLPLWQATSNIMRLVGDALGSSQNSMVESIGFLANPTASLTSWCCFLFSP